jgi:hypothetical protein
MGETDLTNPNSLGPRVIQISEIFGLVKSTAATSVIVTAPPGADPGGVDRVASHRE